MKRCCECKKIVWPWHKSPLAGDVIHAVCHQRILDEYIKGTHNTMRMERHISLKIFDPWLDIDPMTGKPWSANEKPALVPDIASSRVASIMLPDEKLWTV